MYSLMYTNILISVGRKPHLIIMKNKKPHNPHMCMWKISVDCSVTSCVMLTEKNCIRYKMYVRKFFPKVLFGTCFTATNIKGATPEIHTEVHAILPVQCHYFYQVLSKTVICQTVVKPLFQIS